MKRLLFKIDQKYFVLFFALIGFCLSGCEPTNPNDQKVYLPEHKQNELLVWRKSGVTPGSWSAKKTNFQAKYGAGLTVSKKCQNCDDGDLEVWSGSSVVNFISSEVASPTTRPRGNPTGEDDTLYYSLNFIVHLPIENDVSQFPSFVVPPFTSNLPEVTVAVFDTGVDPEITTNYTSNILSCKTGGEKGWNFVDENNNTSDRFSSRHGTVVSKFIVDEVNAHAGGNRVNILPVKIFGADGSSDLFNVLCGFSYAKKAGAKIINASFGFYYYHDDPPKLLAKYVEEVLTSNNILLVAAAGNKIPSEDAIARYGIGVPESGLRNLELHHFYPGGLAKYLPNVYCITTARLAPTVSPSPNQNFSKNIVDIAAIADLPAVFGFYHPFDNTKSVAGSSFATPIFTGKLASWYSTISGALDNKATILNTMSTNAVVFNDFPALGEWIIGGRYVR